MRWTNLALLSAGLLVAVPASAQTTRYPVRSLDFDMWCTEEQHLPPDRCDKRLPEDMQKFEAYRAIIEKYEIPYLQEKEQKLRLDRDIMHHDPVDNSPSDQAAPPKPGSDS